MRLLFAGTPEVAVPSLRTLLSSRHDVIAVLTRPDAPVGRGRHVARSPVAEVAAEHGLEIIQPMKPSDPGFLTRLVELAPECAAVVAYGGLLPRAALDVPPRGWVNLHFSVLPAWRGAAPVQRALMAGDDIIGAATFQIVQDLDAGPVYGVVTEPVQPTDTSGDLLARLSVSGAKLLLSTLDGIADGTLMPRPQPAEGVSYAPKVTVEDAQVDWKAPAVQVDRLVRACTPAPGAWTSFRGERIKLGPVTLTADVSDLAPGELRAAKAALHVGTGTHAVLLGEVGPQGRKPMSAADWARGVRLQPGDRLGE
jgi:methionyl-tRNA formyltransferase